MRIFDLPNQSYRWLLAELVVVVLGILIAFQVEEWRAARVDRVFSESSLRAILAELEDEYADFQLVIPGLQEQLKSGRNLANLLGIGEHRNETELLDAYAGLAGGYGWYPNSPTYTGLRESGRLYLISDSDLVDTMFDYYEFGEYVGIVMNDVELRRDSFRKASLTDVYRIPSSRRTSDSIGRVPLDRHLVLPVEDIPRNPEFLGTLGDLLAALNRATGRFDDLSSRNAVLREIIKAHTDE